MSDSDGPAPEPAGLEGLPPMYSIAKGEVVSVQTYGAFVRLPGYKKEGWFLLQTCHRAVKDDKTPQNSED